MALSPTPLGGSYGYEPPISLWNLVQQYAPVYEHGEIKTMLGESLVDVSIELHMEISALMEIWQDYKEETDNNQPVMGLPEPPAARELLTKEIRFFVESLQEKAKENGRDPDAVLKQHNADILDYVLEDRPLCSSRMSTARSICSRDGRETPRRRGTPNSDGMSLSSTISEEVEAMNEKLNVLKLDEVVQHLRETLESEVDQLKHDIVFLQECLEEEADFRSQGSVDEPSLSELKAERGKLEKHLLTKEDAALTCSPKRAVPKKLQSGLSPIAGISQPKLVKPLSANTRTRLEPVKANHQIEADIPHILDRNSVRSSRLLRDLSSPSHVTIRTTKDIPANATVVSVGSVSTSHKPSPPTSAKPTNRPNSATKFRQRVLACRET